MEDVTFVGTAVLNRKHCSGLCGLAFATRARFFEFAWHDMVSDSLNRLANRLSQPFGLDKPSKTPPIAVPKSFAGIFEIL